MDRTKNIICVELDRISHLPHNVTDQILACLPLRDAVRTSVLSRVWRDKWLTIPSLEFDEVFRHELGVNYKPESIIFPILLLHRGPIVKFTLDGSCFLNDSTAAYLLLFLSNYCIEELDLCFERNLMPYHLFTFGHLRHLYLSNCELKLPSTFKGFHNLVLLSLSEVSAMHEDIKNFISNCSILECLYLDLNHLAFVDLEIDSPSLKSLRLLGDFSLLPMINASNLTKLFLDYSLFEDFDTSKLANDFGLPSSIEKLDIDGRFLKFLSCDGKLEKLPYDLSSLIFLNMEVVDFGFIEDVSGAVCLIRSSSNLQCLRIVAEPFRREVLDYDEPMEATDYLKARQKSEASLSHLKHVMIHEFSGTEPQKEFVRLLLLAATALEKLELSLSRQFATKKGRVKMLKELTSYGRASPVAEIIIQPKDRFDI